jgi:regulator of protease activity HflC (stomatin/prohibitin superfamily)
LDGVLYFRVVDPFKVRLRGRTDGLQTLPSLTTHFDVF